MKVRKSYLKNHKIVAIRRVAKDGYWEETTYDEDGFEVTYKNSDGGYEIKYATVSEEEFNEYVNNK